MQINAVWIGSQVVYRFWAPRSWYSQAAMQNAGQSIDAGLERGGATCDGVQFWRPILRTGALYITSVDQPGAVARYDAMTNA